MPTMETLCYDHSKHDGSTMSTQQIIISRADGLRLHTSLKKKIVRCMKAQRLRPKQCLFPAMDGGNEEIYKKGV